MGLRVATPHSEGLLVTASTLFSSRQPLEHTCFGDVLWSRLLRKRIVQRSLLPLWATLLGRPLNLGCVCPEEGCANEEDARRKNNRQASIVCGGINNGRAPHWCVPRRLTSIVYQSACAFCSVASTASCSSPQSLRCSGFCLPLSESVQDAPAARLASCGFFYPCFSGDRGKD